MAFDARTGEPSDRYAELMARHAALLEEIHRLLLQVASDDDDDAEMMWGDAGQLYYLVTDREDPEEALCTLQGG